MTFGRDKTPATRPAPNLDIRLSLAPITGAPSESISDLNKAIKAQAAKREIKIVPAGDPDTSYVLHGYLSAVGGDSGTVLVFVWDIVDRNGARVHRISGQEISTKGAPDPWAAVSSDTLNLVAQRTVDALYAWLTRL